MLIYLATAFTGILKLRHNPTLEALASKKATAVYKELKKDTFAPLTRDEFLRWTNFIFSCYGEVTLENLHAYLVSPSATVLDEHIKATRQARPATAYVRFENDSKVSEEVLNPAFGRATLVILALNFTHSKEDFVSELLGMVDTYLIVSIGSWKSTTTTLENKADAAAWNATSSGAAQLPKASWASDWTWEKIVDEKIHIKAFEKHLIKSDGLIGEGSASLTAAVKAGLHAGDKTVVVPLLDAKGKQTGSVTVTLELLSHSGEVSNVLVLADDPVKEPTAEAKAQVKEVLPAKAPAVVKVDAAAKDAVPAKEPTAAKVEAVVKDAVPSKEPTVAAKVEAAVKEPVVVKGAHCCS